MAEEFEKDVIVNNNVDTASDTLKAARALYFSRNYEQALKLFLNLLATSELDTTVLIDIGNCYYYLEDFKSALEFWTKAISIDNSSAIAYGNIANYYFRIGEFNKAISFWLKALLIKPENPNTNLNLAIAFDKKGRKDVAIYYYERFLKYESDAENEDYIKIKGIIESMVKTANESLKQGVKSHEQKDFKSAVSLYFKAYSSYPRFAKINYNIGSVFYEDKNFEVAVKYWKKAFYLDSQNKNTLLNLALAYDMKQDIGYSFCYYNRYLNSGIGDKEEFLKVKKRMTELSNVLMLKPTLVEGHLEQAHNFLANCDYEEALEEFENYMILVPNAKETYNLLIKKIREFLNPEKYVIEDCFKTAEQLFLDEDYAQAKMYFDRIMLLSSPDCLEYNQAKIKADKCIRKLNV